MTGATIVRNAASGNAGLGAMGLADNSVAFPVWMKYWVCVDPCPNPVVDLAAAVSHAVSWAVDTIFSD